MSLVCPNKNSPEFKLIASRYNDLTAIALFHKNDNVIPSLEQAKVLVGENIPWQVQETIDDRPFSPIQDNLARLSKELNADIVLNSELEAAAKVQRSPTDASKGIIEIRPEYFEKVETPIHEFGHIYIDVIGGMKNPLVQRGLAQLEGTILANQVRENRKDLTGEKLQKEILATAIGRDAQRIFDGEQLSGWRKWINLFFNRIRQVLGISPTVAQQLARELLTGQLSQPITSQLSSYVQYSKPNAEKMEVLRRREKTLLKSLQGMSDVAFKLKERPADQIHAKKQMEALKSAYVEKRTQAFVTIIHNSLAEQIDPAFDKLVNALDEGTITLNILDEAYTYVKAYGDVLRNLSVEISQTPDLVKELPADVVSGIKRLEDRLGQIEIKYISEGRKVMARALAKNEQRFFIQRERQYESEFLADPANQSIPKKERRVRALEYARQKIKDNTSEINQQTLEYMENELILASQDVEYINVWVDAIKNTSDSVVSLIADLLGKAEHNRDVEYLRFRQQLDGYVDKLREYRNNPADQLELYRDILELDAAGKPTGRVIAPDGLAYSYYEAKEKLYQELTTAAEEGYGDMAGQIRSEWSRENMEYNKEYDIESAEMKKKMTTEEYIEWTQDNDHRRWKPAKHHYNTKAIKKLMDYGEGNPVYDFWMFYTENQQYFDEIVPHNKRLLNRIPGVRKKGYERLHDQRWGLDAINEVVRDITKRQKDDLDRGEVAKVEVDKDGRETFHVIRNLDGSERRVIPVHYRMKLDLEHQSFDLATALALNGYMSLNFFHKNKILPQIELTKELLRTREVKSNKAGLPIINTVLKNIWGEIPDTLQGHASNAFKAAHEMIEGKMYGITSPEADFAGLDPKTWSAILSYTGTVLLSFNFLAGVANISLGQVLTMSEAFGGNYYKGKNLRSAYKFYMSDFGSIVGDVGAGFYGSTTNLLGEYFDALNTFSSLHRTFADNTRFKRLMKTSSLHWLNNSGEHLNHNLTMLSVLQATKATDANGNLIDKHGNIVTNEDKAANLLDVYKKGEKEARIVKDKSFTHARFRNKIVPIDANLEYRIKQAIRQINEDLHGAYSEQNRNEAQKYVLGRMVFMLRKWAVRGFKRRWLGGLEAKRAYKRDQPKTFGKWNAQIQDYQEGYYVNLIDFVMRFQRDLRKMGLQAAILSSKGRWSSMNSYEMGNMRKGLTEVAVLISLYIMYGIMKDLAVEESDDNDKWWWYFHTYNTRRLLSEMFVYANPNEAFRILQNPAASVMMMRRMVDVVGQAFDPFEEYQGGRRYGDSKMIKKLKDLAPFVNQYERLLNIDEALQFYTN